MRVAGLETARGAHATRLFSLPYRIRLLIAQREWQRGYSPLNKPLTLRTYFLGWRCVVLWKSRREEIGE